MEELLTWLLSSLQCCCLPEIQQDWFLHQGDPSERRGCRCHRFSQDPTRLPQPRSSNQAEWGGSRQRCWAHLAHPPRRAEAGTPRSLIMNTPVTFRQSQSPSVGFFELISLNCGIYLIVKMISDSAYRCMRTIRDILGIQLVSES